MRCPVNIALLCVLVICSIDFTYSQTTHTNLKFVKYSTSAGLSSDNQKCIVQDREGFIWIGTGDGLNRFDGQRFKVYRSNPHSNTSLGSNIITDLFCDGDGRLWIGTYGGGLSRYNIEKDNFVTYHHEANNPRTLCNDEITTIAEDKHHRLWIGTTEGLQHYDPATDSFQRYPALSNQQRSSLSPANNSINRISCDGDTLWIAYAYGFLSALNTTDMTFRHFKLFEIASFQTANFSFNGIVAEHDRVWLSTWSKGIWIFDKATSQAHPFEQEGSKYINFFFKDNSNNYWYNPEGGGLVLLSGKTKTEYTSSAFDPYSISSNSLSGIFQDRQNNIWITNKNGDLNYTILNNPFYNWYQSPDARHGLTHNLVNAVIEDSKHRIWAGYDNGGIDILDAQGAKPTYSIKGDRSSGLGPGPVMAIFESRNGTIWVGKYLDGLKKYNESTRTFTSYLHDDHHSETISGNDIRYIDEDTRGNLWIAIHGGGVDQFDPQSNTFIHHRPLDGDHSASIGSDWTYTSFVDRSDQVWVGSVNGVSVVSVLSPAVKQYGITSTAGHSLSNPLALATYVDSKGIAWIGTNDGLNRIDRTTDSIKHYFVGDGLPGNAITEILEDDHDNLWIGTSKGISKFSPATEQFTNYSISDGLITDHITASSKSASGTLYFAGKGGIIRFHPDSIRISHVQSPVYLTDFRLFNKSVAIAGDTQSDEFTLPQQISECREIELKYNQNVITIGFVALNFQNLEKNQYKYRLEGFQNDWVWAGHQREVTYTNLNPGEYTFRVIASNSDGIWNEEGASLKIIVLPPIWKTRWAYALYLLLLLLLLYGFRKLILHEAEIEHKLKVEELEIKKLQEIDTLKMHFFSNVSHEFRTPLTLITGPVETLLRTVSDESHRLQLNLIKRHTIRLLRLVNQLMDFRKIEEANLEMNFEKSDIVQFSRNIVDSFNHEANERKIRYDFLPVPPSLEVFFDHDKLDKIFYNLLSNAFKFTDDGGMIRFSLLAEDESVTHSGRESHKTIKIIVQDSGIGIPKESQQKIFDRFYQVNTSPAIHGTGIGLSLSHELIRLHHGTISLESEPDNGSTFTVNLPLWTEESELPSPSAARRSDRAHASAPLEPNSTPGFVAQDAFEKTNETKPHLLIIDDNADMRAFIKNEFRELYHSTEARNGTIGIEKALEEIPDAIICDIMMPGIDGYQVCRTLKQDEKTSHIPILMLTAKSSEEHTIEGFESGADDYVSKPFSSALLKARIKNLIDSRERLRKNFLKAPYAAITDFSPSKTDEELLKKAYTLVEKNLSNPNWEVNDFAYEIGMSRTQLYRKINALSGQTVREFIKIIRLKKAAEFLLTSEKNITEIADEVGFNSQSYFTTAFTEHFGINPSKYADRYMKTKK